MPDIRELLHEAAPSAQSYDETAVRRRIAVRRRRRRGWTAAMVAVTVVVGFGGAMAIDRDGGESPVRLVDQPPAAKQAGVTALALFDGEVWVGTDGAMVARDGDDPTFSVSGSIRSMATGDVLWVAGDDWVAALDAAAPADLGRWDSSVDGGRIADIQPLEGQHVAVSLPDADSIAIVRVSAEGLEELSRIPVNDPSDLVLTLDDELWVNDGDVIRRVEWGAGGTADEHEWSGALLAPSTSGGIWAVEGDRVVDLHPELLAEGQSVALGARYNVPGATMAVAAGERLYVGGPFGIVQHVANDSVGLTVATDEPVAMAADGVDLVYVTGGTVRRFESEVADRAATEDSITSLIEAREVAQRFLTDELGWPDATIEIDEVPPGAGSATAEWRTVTASSPSLERDARVTLQRVGDSWEVTGLWTFGDAADDGAGVSLGHGDDAVHHSYREEGLTAELTVRYGDHETVLTAEDDVASWEGDLGFVPDTPGLVQVLYRNADGIAVEGWRTTLPAGPFAAG